jgi:hypothetical protein
MVRLRSLDVGDRPGVPVSNPRKAGAGLSPYIGGRENTLRHRYLPYRRIKAVSV